MKKVLSLILILALLTTTVCFADGHVHFTSSSYSGVTEGTDNYSDDVYKILQDKFDFDMELFMLTGDTGADKNRMWINSGTMPDFTFWADFDYTEYLSYIEQGLIKALPDGWEEKYPNLADEVRATGISELIKVNGKTYCLPKVIFYAFSPIDSSVSSACMFYRLDWAKEVGIELGTTCTLEEFLAYVEAVQKLDPLGNGQTIGIASATSTFSDIIMRLYNVYYKSFQKVDGQYIWGPTKPETVDGLNKLREIYDANLLDRDFYLCNTSDAMNVFCSGRSAALAYQGQVDHIRAVAKSFREGTGVENAYDYVRATTIVNDDGKWHGVKSSNFWAASLFSPSIEDETFDRILAIMDYLCTVEGQELINLGIEGKDFSKDAATGEYTMLREPNADGSWTTNLELYPCTNFFYTLIVLVDSFAFVNPIYDKEAREQSIDMYLAKLDGVVDEYTNVEIDFYTSAVKSQYSIPINDVITQTVLDRENDAADLWNNMIETNRSMWEPLLDEYNEAFGE